MAENKKNSQAKSFPLLIASKGTVLYPGFKGPLEFVDKFSVKAANVAAANGTDKENVLITIENDTKSDPDITKNLEKVGVLGKARIMKTWNDGTVTVEVEVTKRVDIDKVEVKDDSYLTAEYSEMKEKKMTEDEIADFKAISLKLIPLIKDLGDDLKKTVNEEDLNNPKVSLLDQLDDIYRKLQIKDKTLETKFVNETNPVEKLKTLLEMVLKSIDTTDVDNDINKKMKSKIDSQQKEFYLREKMKAIKEELGDDNDKSIEHYKERLANEPFPQHVKDRMNDEIDKYESMQPSSTEANVQRSYIDWMMSLPWFEKTEDNTDIANAEKVLDEDHYGLKKVKERIIEYLAAKQKSKGLKGQIITLVGPPGVGKTSLAKSIAKALGRKFVKVSLGGIRDEAEIRGHRRTYVGAMPGRIIQSMKRAGVTNPVFLLDEVDKMNQTDGYKGDPSSAMLEVLDPEQNAEFSDNYIEEPYDLSDVMFIATANYAQDIPEALYDRMEVIDLSSYTEIEKLKIAKEYLIPKVLKQYNLTDKEVKFTDEGISEIIKYYTREAGVRQLERLINSICRKFIVKQLKEGTKSITVTPEVVTEMLKKHMYENTEKGKTDQIGVVTGLAWTQFGGDILPIEVNYYPGKGGLVITGNLKDVMKESATVAVDFVKANYDRYGIDKKIFEENDIHIHVPEGAVPKDGPSAGVTLATAVISALSNRPVSNTLGMTGEITLRGHVLPIGGLREKSISASRSGLKKILIPWENQKDLDEVPDEVKKVLEIVPVKEYDDVYFQVFGEKPKERATK